MAKAHTRQIEEACKSQSRGLVVQRDSARVAAQCAEADLQEMRNKLAAAKVAPLWDIILMAVVVYS
jgi:hypothetical protein